MHRFIKFGKNDFMVFLSCSSQVNDGAEVLLPSAGVVVDVRVTYQIGGRAISEALLDNFVLLDEH